MTGEKEVKNYSAILFCGSDILSYTQILKMIHDELDNVLPPVDLHQATDCSNTPPFYCLMPETEMWWICIVWTQGTTG